MQFSQLDLTTWLLLKSGRNGCPFKYYEPLRFGCDGRHLVSEKVGSFGHRAARLRIETGDRRSQWPRQ